jgi:putative flavoprotein involved in K+ transport
MRRVQTTVIGAGQAGLAMSHCLARYGIDHVVLERGRVAERWRSERWDSLRLLTPNWMSRLPGWSYQGADADGYMAMPELIRYLEEYARFSGAPIETGVAVRSVRRLGNGYRVDTSRGPWEARAVVIATGHCDRPLIPGSARTLASGIHQLTPSDYRNPASIPAGGVLVVGASASGVQLAEELRRSGHAVTISVGRHTRLPRLYRGRDIMWWMDRIGLLDQEADRVRDLQSARGQPSLQLVGHPDRRSIDLRVLRDGGVRVVGRTAGIEPHILHLEDDLAATIKASQNTLERLLMRIDAHPAAAGLPSEQERPHPIELPPSPTSLDLKAENIRTVLWATGFRRSYTWLNVPVFDGAGEIIHRGGITPAPGLYVLGLRFMRRRKSSFIDGVGGDAEALAEHIANQLSGSTRQAA